ncbi:MAG: hypothetical protein LUC90_00115, partial [Lachnospiraceae bacterium]|nr:hypothetical protein [Lachnospiraceae bacterium]
LFHNPIGAFRRKAEYNDEEFNDITSADRKIYMLDGIHPTKIGYRDWWTPYMREYLISYLCE